MRQSLGSNYDSRPDRLVIDLSPLRCVDNSRMAADINEIIDNFQSDASGAGVTLNGDLSSDIGLLNDQTSMPTVSAATGTTANDDDEEDGDEAGLKLTKGCLLSRPIWDLPVLLLTFDCVDRKTAKAAAKTLAGELCFKLPQSPQLSTKTHAKVTDGKRELKRRIRYASED